MRHVLKVVGHLSVAAIKEQFSPLGETLEQGRGQQHDVLVDLASMEGYDVAARDWFIQEWSKRFRPLIRRFAVVTTKTSWRVIATTIGMVTRTQMKAFESVREAEKWIDRA